MTPIYVPTAGSPATLEDLRDLVNRRTTNTLDHGTHTETATAYQSVFRLPDQNISDLSVTVDGSSTSSGTLDAQSGYYVFGDSGLDEGVVAVFTYTFRHWSDEQVNDAINGAIAELWGAFYTDPEFATFTTTGAASYAALDVDGNPLDNNDRVTHVHLWRDPMWVKWEHWSISHNGGQKYVDFSRPRYDGGTVRITYVKPLATFTDDTVSMTDVGFDEKTAEMAKWAVVDLAIAELISERIPVRIRDDRAHNSQNEQAIKSYEMVNDAQFYRARALLRAKVVAPPRLSGRVHP